MLVKNHQFEPTQPLFGGLCGLMVERLLAIQKVAGLNLGRSASR